MPAYSFKEVFVPFIKDRSKRQTIRSRRKRPARPGDTLYLYYGLRTKWTTKIQDEICELAKSVYIDKNGVAVFEQKYYEDIKQDTITRDILRIQIEYCWSMNIPHFDFKIHGSPVTIDAIYPAGHIMADKFAWKDGFRPEGSTLENPGKAFDMMVKFWELPFVGDIIYW